MEAKILLAPTETSSHRHAIFNLLCGYARGKVLHMKATRPRGRPPKYPPDEVRARLVDSAIMRLKVSGVESGLDSITLDGAIVDADVPRGMAYRIWQHDDLTPQEAFRRTTVLELLSIPATAGLPATREKTEKLLAEYRDWVESDKIEERKQAFHDMVRAVGNFNYEALATSSNWKLYSALRTAAITRPNSDPELMQALRAGEAYLIEQYSQLYEELREIFGLELRPGYTMAQFTMVCYAVNEGLASRVITVPNERLLLPTGEQGEDQEWSLFSIAFDALVERFFIWPTA